MFKSIFWRCRGFALAAPFFVALAYVVWLQPASGSDPDVTNAVIHACVDAERAAGRNGRACIGRVTGPCKARPENTHRDDKMECDEREFVLWSQLVQKEYAALEKLLKPSQQEKLRQAQNLWIKFQSDDCRLPYVLFPQAEAEFSGPACTIELKAARALQLRAWRDALTRDQ